MFVCTCIAIPKRVYAIKITLLWNLFFHELRLRIKPVCFVDNCSYLCLGRRDRMVVCLQLHVQSVPFTTKPVSSNPVHGKMHFIQHYLITFLSDLRKVGGFLQLPPTIKLTVTI
jgi:hypothetical protein